MPASVVAGPRRPPGRSGGRGFAELGVHRDRVAVAIEVDVDAVTGQVLTDDAAERGRAGDLLAVDRDDDVTALDAGVVGRRAAGHRLHVGARVDLHVAAVELRLLDVDRADPEERRLQSLAEPFDDDLRVRDGDRETDVLRAPGI